MMDGDHLPIEGAKGGSSQPHAAVEAPDSLHSIAYARILDLVSEGEIEGFAHGTAGMLQDIALDDTPIGNADGSLNFKNVKVDSRAGTQAQLPMSGFPDVENTTQVNVELKSTAAWTQTITDLSLSAVRLTLSVGALSRSNTTTGDITGYTIQYAIDVQTDTGSFYTVLTSAFSGKTTSQYQRSHRIDLPAGAVSSWTLRIRRLTANQNLATVQDTMMVDYYTEIVDAQLAYPNSAYVGLIIDASQFRSIPRRAFNLLGRIISIPSNYNPTTRQYTGTWDGTFTSAWTNNPAWIFYDLATNNRFGLGQYVSAAQVNKWNLYTIAQYCDQYVPTGQPARALITTGSQTFGATAPNLYTRATGSFVTDGFQVGDEINATGFGTAANNGRGVVTAVSATQLTIDATHVLVTEAAAAGCTIATEAPTEPRFACSLFLQKQADAYKVLQDLASIFRGISYWASGAIQAVADMPADPVYTYTAANVIDGKFTYQGSAKKTRFTVALVSWNDQNDHGRAKVEYVPDTVGISRYGIQITQFTAIGCTSQSQAHRAGLWALLTSRLETGSNTFKVGLDGTIAAPGQIIRTSDPARAGKRQAGRVSAATATAITVDKAPTVAVGDNLTCTLPSGVTETHAVTAVAGNVISVASPGFSAVPVAQSVWVVESTSLAAETYRVVSVGETGSGDKLEFTITGVLHNASKFAAIDNGAPTNVPTVSAIPPPAQAAPASVTITSVPTAGAVLTSTLLNIQWPATPSAVWYEAEWRKDYGPWQPTGKQGGLSVDVHNAQPGVYDARVRAWNASNVGSPYTSAAQLTVSDQTTQPTKIGTIGPGGNIGGAVDVNGRPIIDLTQPGHIGKSLANIPDDATSARYAVYSIDGNRRALVDFSQGGHVGKILDNIDEGSGYFRMPAANMSGVGGRALIDFTQGHINKTLDNVGDGITYVRYLGSDATGNRLDFSKGLLNKHLGNIPDDATSARYAVANIDGNRRALIDFTQGSHVGKNQDNIPAGATWGATKLAALQNGIPLQTNTGRSLVVNGSFELNASGSAMGDGWGIPGPNMARALGVAGAPSHAVLQFNLAPGWVINTGFVFSGLNSAANFPIHVGDKILLSAEFENAGNTALLPVGITATFQVAVVFVDQNGNTVNGGPGVVANLTASGWNIVTASAVVPAGVSSAYCQVLAYTNNTTGSAWTVPAGQYPFFAYVDNIAGYAVANADTDVMDGTTHGRIAMADVFQVGGVNRVGVRVAGSGQHAYIDFGDNTAGGHVAKHLGNVPDDLTSNRYAISNGAGLKGVSSVDPNKLALIDFTQPGHTGKVIDNLGDGAYARILASQLSGGQHKLEISGSGHQIGDQRANVALNAAGPVSRWVNLTISYTATAGSPATATINVSAASLAGVLPNANWISYNASSASVSGTGGTNVTYYLYYNDPGMAGGTQTLAATTNGNNVYLLTAVYIGSVTVSFPSSGSGSGGGSGGLCVADEMFVRKGLRAGDAKIGDAFDCIDLPTSAGKHVRALQGVERGTEECVRIITDDGCALECSVSTPFDLPDGRQVTASHMLGEPVMTDLGTAMVTSLALVGRKPVTRAHLGGVSYAAGADPHRRIYSHNSGGAKP